MIDEWGGSTGKSYTAGRELSGRHYVTVEHYQGTGSASLRFDFEYMGSVLIWEANYYRGTTPGGKPELTRREPRTLRPIDHTWGSGSPLPALFGKGSWSAQWEGNFFFQGGTYIFHANADDGVRIYLNNILVLDKWRDGYHEVQNRFVGIGAGEHTIRVEYYEVAGEATLQVWWSRETTVN